MADRYIVVPADITLMSNGKPISVSTSNEDGTTTPPVPVTYSFKQFIRHLLDDTERFGNTAPKIRTAVRLELALDKVEVGGVLQIAEEDWKLLHQVAEEPKHGYPALMFGQQQIPIARQLLPYIDLLKDPPNRVDQPVVQN